MKNNYLKKWRGNFSNINKTKENKNWKDIDKNFNMKWKSHYLLRNQNTKRLFKPMKKQRKILSIQKILVAKKNFNKMLKNLMEIYCQEKIKVCFSLLGKKKHKNSNAIRSALINYLL